MTQVRYFGFVKAEEVARAAAAAAAFPYNGYVYTFE